MFLIDKDKNRAVSLEKRSFSELYLSERNDLQEWIAHNPVILGERLLIIQKEFAGFSDTKERLDLLALDENGNLVIIENKLDDSGRDVVWQALKYVSYCATLTKADICEIYQNYLSEGLISKDKIAEFYNNPDFESIRLNPNDGDQRIFFVAANFRKEVTSTVLWLRDHGVDITCIKVSVFMDDGKLYLDTEQILPIKDIGDYQIKLSAKKQEDIISSGEEATRQKLIRKFWEKALPVLRKRTGLFANVSPSADNWLNGSSGVGGVEFNPVILKDKARAELYIDTGDADRNRRIFMILYAEKEEYAKMFSAEIDWQELPNRRACRICVFYIESGLLDVEHWEDAISFLAENIAKLMEVFKPALASVLGIRFTS